MEETTTQFISDFIEFVNTPAFEEAFATFLEAKYPVGVSTTITSTRPTTGPAPTEPSSAPSVIMNTGQEPSPADQPTPNQVNEDPPTPQNEQPTPNQVNEDPPPPPSEQPPTNVIE